MLDEIQPRHSQVLDNENAISENSVNKAFVISNEGEEVEEEVGDSPMFKNSEMNDTSFFKPNVLEFDPPGVSAKGRGEMIANSESSNEGASRPDQNNQTIDFTNVSFSQELVVQGDELLDRNVTEMLLFPDNGSLEEDKIPKRSDLGNQGELELLPAMSEYGMLDDEGLQDDDEGNRSCHDESEASSIHNTNNNSMNFSNIFNQMNESAANQSGLIFNANSQNRPGFSEEKLLARKQR